MKIEAPKETSINGIRMLHSVSSEKAISTASSLSVQTLTAEGAEEPLDDLNPFFIFFWIGLLLLLLILLLTLVVYIRKLLFPIREQPEIQEEPQRLTVNENEPEEILVEEPAQNSGGFSNQIPLVPLVPFIVPPPSRKNSRSVHLQ